MFAHLLKITEIWHLYKYSDPLLSTLLKHLWQQLQLHVFLGMTLQAWHTCIWGVSPILLCWSSEALSGWLHRYFQVFPEMFDRVQVQALAGPLKDIQRLVLKPHLHCLGCVLRADVLLEGKSLPHSVLSALEQVFIKDHSTLPRSTLPRSWLVFQSLPLKNIHTAWFCHNHASP